MQPNFINIFFIILSIIGISSKIQVQITIARVATIFSACNFIAIMIYQCSYIHQKNFVDCVNTPNTSWTVNNAEWIGFRKISRDESLIKMVSPHFWFLFLVTISTFISWRQRYTRDKNGERQEVPESVFRNIKRSDADKGFKKLFKYFLNFSFYKFGLEVLPLSINLKRIYLY